MLRLALTFSSISFHREAIHDTTIISLMYNVFLSYVLTSFFYGITNPMMFRHGRLTLNETVISFSHYIEN